MHPSFTGKDIPAQNGTRVLVTGATGGLGFETARVLAKCRAEVLLTGRNAEKGHDAVERIQKEAPGALVCFEVIDLANLTSIRTFAERLLLEGRPLDILINNAGVMAYPERRQTIDGFEAQFGTNHLGHFALTGRLLPLLRKANLPRVVTVSSLAHRSGRIHFQDLQSQHRYQSWQAYRQSKLANLLFTFELQRRSDANAWRIRSNAAHPGLAWTDLIENGPGRDSKISTFARLFMKLFGHSAAAGALPTLYAATAMKAKASGYYGPDGMYETRGAVRDALVARHANDIATAKRLWQISEELTGVIWPSA